MTYRIVEYRPVFDEPAKKVRVEHDETWDSRDMAQLAVLLLDLSRSYASSPHYEVEPVTEERRTILSRLTFGKGKDGKAD